MSILQEVLHDPTEQVGMTESGPEILFEQDINRLLTEVDHLLSASESSGTVSEAVKADVTTNLETALAEVSMPFAVTRTAHKVETVWDAEAQRSHRTFRWLGRCAVGVAKSGYDFHSSDAAIQRVDVEVAEAAHAQETLKAGKVQFFLSPRMSEHDAPAYIAKAEHLHDQDSIRASYIVTDSAGNETYRVMESLLITDVPLEAWVTMLADENNIFGSSITVDDQVSALSVMETFKELELSSDLAAEGPVTLVEAVVPYIQDDAHRLNVLLQLEKFRSDQELYNQQAKQYGSEWYDFELELARSLQNGLATPAVYQFIDNVTPLWAKDVREFVSNHVTEDGLFMTRELAAIAEKAKRNIIATKAAIKTGNEHVIEQVDAALVKTIQNDSTGSSSGYANDDVLTRQLEQSIVKENVELGGGCTGGVCGLESVEDKAAAALIKELGGKEGDKVLKDVKRSCPECDTKGLVYVFNDKEVRTKCMNCKKENLKKTK